MRRKALSFSEWPIPLLYRPRRQRREAPTGRRAAEHALFRALLGGRGRTVLTTTPVVRSVGGLGAPGSGGGSRGGGVPVVRRRRIGCAESDRARGAPAARRDPQRRARPRRTPGGGAPHPPLPDQPGTVARGAAAARRAGPGRPPAAPRGAGGRAVHPGRGRVVQPARRARKV